MSSENLQPVWISRNEGEREGDMLGVILRKNEETCRNFNFNRIIHKTKGDTELVTKDGYL